MADWVVVVDDDVTNLKMAGHVLNKQGMRVTALKSGAALLNYLQDNEPDRLTDEEYEVIKTHPALGGNILGKIKEMPKLAIGARWHHERYDGTGYPDGLKGEDIPEEARIIAVADAYDAMTSRRSYRDVLSQEFVHDELIRCSGTQFDPTFAAIMLQMMAEDADYTMRET